MEEHLWFYARVKGATNSEIALEMEEMLKHLNLPHKRKELTKNLSGEGTGLTGGVCCVLNACRVCRMYVECVQSQNVCSMYAKYADCAQCVCEVCRMNVVCMQSAECAQSV